MLDDAGAQIELGSSARLLARANRLSALCTLDTIADYTDETSEEDLAWTGSLGMQ